MPRPEESSPERIRTRATYRKFNALRRVVETGDTEAILRAVWEELNNRRAFRSSRNAAAALQSLNLVLEDHAPAYSLRISRGGYNRGGNVLDDNEPISSDEPITENTLGNFPRR